MELFFYHLVLLGISLLLSQSLALIWRMNRLSLGHHGFAAAGAYAAVVLLEGVGALGFSGPTSAGARVVGVCVLAASIFLGAAAAATVALLVDPLFRRLRDDYFAVATLVLAEVIQNVAGNTPILARGYEAPYLVLGNSGGEREAYVRFYAVLAVSMGIALYWWLVRLDQSTEGVRIRAIADDDIAASSVGVDVAALQRRVLMIACAAAGAAGALQLQFTTFVQPSDYSFTAGIATILYVVLGRAETTRTVIATIVMYASYEALKLRMFGLAGEAFGAFVARWKDTGFASVLLAAVLVAVWRRRAAARVVS